MTDEVLLADEPGRGQYQARRGDEVLGLAAYRLAGDVITFTHTEVDPACEGQGIGGQLARYALDDARRRGLVVVPRCSFIAGWIDRHPEYADLVDRSSR